MTRDLAFTKHAGSRIAPRLQIYALSTCGFCKRAIAWLESKGYSFECIHLDTIPVETKNEVKKELAEQFHHSVAFPFLVIDGKEALVGFIEEDWVKKLGDRRD